MVTESRDPKTGQIRIEGGKGNDNIKVSNKLDDDGNVVGVNVDSYNDQGKLAQHFSYGDEELKAGGLSIDGGKGNDSIDATDVQYDLRLSGGDGKDFIVGGKGNDIIVGGKGDDIIDGGDGNDSILGGRGDDIISGSGGDDFIHGDTGNDFLDGDTGTDQIYGDRGLDLVVGDPTEDSVLNPGTDRGDELVHPSDLHFEEPGSEESGDSAEHSFLPSELDTSNLFLATSTGDLFDEGSSYGNELPGDEGEPYGDVYGSGYDEEPVYGADDGYGYGYGGEEV